ncbi:hypothetical protein C0J52_21213 [Blattella germanica]|nr:hypothetical protein C0J52_21213 [Blattella germanica]
MWSDQRRLDLTLMSEKLLASYLQYIQSNKLRLLVKSTRKCVWKRPENSVSPLAAEETIRIMESRVVNLKAMLPDLHCVNCEELLQGPTAVCESGHTFCSDCRPKLTACTFPMCVSDVLHSVRNLVLEEISGLVQNKCPNHRNGCRTLLSEELMASHERACAFNIVQCPALQVPSCRCEWEGPRSKLLAHVARKHLDKMARANYFNCTAIIDDYCLLVHQDELFLYYKRSMRGLWYAVVVSVGLTSSAFKSIFTLQRPDSELQLQLTFAVQALNDEPLGEILATGKCLVLDEVLVGHFIENDQMNLHVSVERL